MKKLSDYAVVMDEDKYHAKKCLSYSILANYERNERFKSLPDNWSDLWKPTPKTDALIFGGAVDAILTGGQDKFISEYKVVDIPAVQDKVKQVIDKMVELGIGWNESDKIMSLLDEIQFYPNWRKDTRMSKISEGKAYYDAISGEDKRIVMTSDMYKNVIRVCNDLHNSKLVSSLMFDELPEGKERFFQLKFIDDVYGIKFKIMCDMIIVDHNKKQIQIYDLKTTGKESYLFKHSYLDWGYHIQSWMYRITLREALSLTEYDEYNIEGFYFIVASKVGGLPTVWRDESELSGNKYRNPITIAKEIVSSYDNDGYRKTMPKWCSAEEINILNFE